MDSKTVKFVINCPLYQFSKWKSEITLVKRGSGWFPLPCNGCDMLGGSSICEQCRAAITLMFYENPELDVSRPITPRFKKDT